MRITGHARVGAGLLAAGLILAALPAWAQSHVAESAEERDEVETPSRSWNVFDAESEEPSDAQIKRERRRAGARKPLRVVVRPPEPPPAPEPPSFGELDAVVPASARTTLGESFARWAPGTERVLHELQLLLPESWQPALDAIGDFATETGGRRTLLAALALAIALLVAARVARGHGDLVVVIAYPDDLRGSFTVTLSRRKPRAERSSKSERDAARNKVSTRFEHYLVARETQFRALAPGRYWVLVDGEIFSGASDAAIEEPFEVQPVHVRSRDTQRLEFDLRPRNCPVEVRVVWDNQTVRECAVAARGRPDTLRHTRGQSVRIGLPIGKHVIAVGSGDRVAEREIVVDDYTTQIVEVDLGRTDGVLFKGCPPAVSPYLAGDVQSAARALAREGQDKISNLLLARMHVEQGNADRAAEHFEYAEHFAEAAKLREQLRDFVRAAALFQKCSQPMRAGEMFQRAGDPVRAGKAFEAAGDLERALACYREGGDTERVIGVLERRGETFQAARLATDHADRARAIKLLQQILPDHPNYTEACLMLTDALETEGHVDLAARKLEERVQRGGDVITPDLLSRLAQLWEKANEPGRALDVLEKLRTDEPTWPDLSTRIDALRRRLSSERTTTGRTTAQRLAEHESRYELLEQIGRGGMGVVYRARDKRLGREVALKRLPENLRDHPAAVQLFLREARAAAALNHPNIVTVHDADQEADTFFITMELLEGDPLHVILRRAGRLSARDTARLGVQICAGLEYAHERRIVHRDIKTSNLFFTRGKVVKIMDFGLAKMLEEVRRSATVIGGTPYYMAPEQAAGENVDARADLYALGVTFFELATGAVPFREGDVVYHHRHTPPPDPRRRAEGIPDGFAELILALLVKDPAQRVASARAVAEKLAPFTG
jgi:tRNA A-37 threonylcarbamoyl transferase component Bud32